ncbi:MAG: hypothetical protein ACC662_12345, partial [Planctomycetota bacterium]
WTRNGPLPSSCQHSCGRLEDFPHLGHFVRFLPALVSGRWTSRRKMEVVLRLLRGEDVEVAAVGTRSMGSATDARIPEVVGSRGPSGMEQSGVADEKGEAMGRIVRYEFLGSRFWFWLLFASGIGLPLAILYLMATTVRVEDEVGDATAFVEEFRRSRSRRG